MKYIIKEYDTRYFAGIELIGGFKIGSDGQKKVPELWKDLDSLYLNDISNIKEPLSRVGLEIYRYDFMESKMVDYYAMVQTNDLIEVDDTLVTKKLPRGKYILFPIAKEKVYSEIKNVYKFVENQNFNVHLGFHIEIFDDNGLNTNEKTMYISFKLDE